MTRSERQSKRAPDGVSVRLWDEFASGSRRACAKIITLVENEPQLVPAIREALAPRLGGAIRIGITGPPGVGKSTLCSAVAEGLAAADHRVGIIAVDPSSPFTGGAFMGDRIRMDRLVGDERVFMRSMASREGRGGLSPSTPFVADVIEAFGMDRILIETVGVGQAELDVIGSADLVVLVLQPGTGDSIQTMKAGIIECADLIVVNKADLPGVDTVIQSLRFLFSLGGPRRGKPVPPIVATSAQKTEGIELLVHEIEKLSTGLFESGRYAELRVARMQNEIRSALEQEIWIRFEQIVGAATIRATAEDLVNSGGSPYPFVRKMSSSIELKIRET
jgi:LAO/AO transport system kinase